VRSPFWVVAAAACGVGLLRTPGFVSHASEGNISVLGSVADLVHLIGVAAWLGGLVMLVVVVLPRRRPAELAAIVPKYSQLAFGSITAVVVAGSIMSWELVGSFTGFADTRFGHVLALKLLLFVFVMGAAYVSKRWVDQRLSVAVTLRGHASLVRPFVLSVATEAVLATGILAVASVLVATSPAR
jgi:putative copper export protein